MPDIDDPFLEEVEPTAAQVGIDVPGSRSGFTDFINHSVYNGAFGVGPPDISANIDVVSASGSNFLPGFRFIQSSNTTITGKHVSNTASATGSTFQFVFTSATTGHAAYLEQIVDVGGSTASWLSNTVRSFAKHSTDNAQLSVRLQYLTTSGSIEGMPPEYEVIGTVIDGYSRILMAAESATGSKYAPPTARYLRIRLEAKALATIASGTIDVFEVRRTRGFTEIRLINDSNVATTKVPATVTSVANEMYYTINTTEDIGASGSMRLLSRQLIGIGFSLLNVPASATTEMQPFDNALGFGSPRIGSPWGGDIVGVSYRMSAAISAGGASALKIEPTIAGTRQYTAHTLTTTSSQSGEDNRSLDGYPFTAGQQLGIQIVTSGTFAPTTLDIACILWVAIKYNGA